MRTKEQVFQYLIQPSPLFLKQVVQVAETKDYIVVQDLRNTKKLTIPDKVIQDYEFYLNIIKTHACKANEYEGVKYIIFCKS